MVGLSRRRVFPKTKGDSITGQDRAQKHCDFRFSQIEKKSKVAVLQLRENTAPPPHSLRRSVQAFGLKCSTPSKYIHRRKYIPVTYIRVTRNSNKIPILNSNNTVVYLLQVNEGNSIPFIYTIGFYRCFEYTA